MPKVAYACTNLTTNTQALAAAGTLAAGQLATFTVETDSKEENAILHATAAGYISSSMVSIPAAFSGAQLLSTVHTNRSTLAVTQQTLVYASTITPDASLGDIMQVTLTGAPTMAIPINPQYVGQIITMNFIQAGSGSYAVTWTTSAGGFKKAADGSAGAAGTMASTMFSWSGTYWVQCGGAIAYH